MLPFLVTVGCSGDGEPEPSKGTDQEPLPDDVELTVDGILGYLEKKETVVMVETKGILGEGLDGAFFLTFGRSYGDVELVMEWEEKEYRYTLKERDMEITGNKLVLDKGDTYFSYDTSNGAIDFVVKGEGWHREVTSRGMSSDIYDYRPTMEEFKAFEGEWIEEVYIIDGIVEVVSSFNVGYFDGIVTDDEGEVYIYDDGIVLFSCSDHIQTDKYRCGVNEYYRNLQKSKNGMLFSEESMGYDDMADTLYYTLHFFPDSIARIVYNTYNKKESISWTLRKK